MRAECLTSNLTSTGDHSQQQGQYHEIAQEAAMQREAVADKVPLAAHEGHLGERLLEQRRHRAVNRILGTAGGI